MSSQEVRYRPIQDELGPMSEENAVECKFGRTWTDYEHEKKGERMGHALMRMVRNVGASRSHYT